MDLSIGAPDRATAVTRAVRDGSRLDVVLADLAAPVDEALAVAVVRLVADEALLVELQAAPGAATAVEDRWRVLQACADHLRGEGVRRAAALGPLVPELAEPHGSGRATADPATERLRLFEAVLDLLRAEPGGRPLVVVLEDAHWADVDSLRLLDLLASSCATPPCSSWSPTATRRRRPTARSPGPWPSWPGGPRSCASPSVGSTGGPSPTGRRRCWATASTSGPQP